MNIRSLVLGVILAVTFSAISLLWFGGGVLSTLSCAILGFLTGYILCDISTVSNAWRLTRAKIAQINWTPFRGRVGIRLKDAKASLQYVFTHGICSKRSAKFVAWAMVIWVPLSLIAWTAYMVIIYDQGELPPAVSELRFCAFVAFILITVFASLFYFLAMGEYSSTSDSQPSKWTKAWLPIDVLLCRTDKRMKRAEVHNFADYRKHIRLCLTGCRASFTALFGIAAVLPIGMVLVLVVTLVCFLINLRNVHERILCGTTVAIGVLAGGIPHRFWEVSIAASLFLSFISALCFGCWCYSVKYYRFDVDAFKAWAKPYQRILGC